ncbi:MAG TPA: glucose 1-dehydrogenase [Candidatus Binataceae bacterium]|nr:glucose 1-dehydrogenase [Candidatus Binataceae bacterium]
MRLKDKIALITGGGSGIGEATAKTFAREGAAVVVVDLNEEGAARVAGEIRKTGGMAESLVADAGVPKEIERMIKFPVNKFGRLDILHNNAIFVEAGHIHDLSLEGWQKTLDVGLTAYWYAIKIAIQTTMLKQGRGAIVNTASVSGLAGDYTLGAYNAVKAGVVNISRVTGIEYARKGIRCNAVCPGPIATPPLARIEAERPDVVARVRDAIPMGRLGKPQEIANVVLFLASDEASFVTGAFFVADGGLWAHSGMPSLSGQGPEW